MKAYQSSPSTVFEYIYIYIRPHACPRDLYFLLCITPTNPPAFEHWESRALPSVETDEMCSSPAASINPSKVDAASPTATGPPGKLRGSDCSGSIGTVRAIRGTQDYSTSPASMLQTIRGETRRGPSGTPSFKVVRDHQHARRGAW